MAAEYWEGHDDDNRAEDSNASARRLKADTDTNGLTTAASVCLGSRVGRDASGILDELPCWMQFTEHVGLVIGD
jgi:hypothetical protein